MVFPILNFLAGPPDLHADLLAVQATVSWCRKAVDNLVIPDSYASVHKFLDKKVGFELQLLLPDDETALVFDIVCAWHLTCGLLHMGASSASICKRFS